VEVDTPPGLSPSVFLTASSRLDPRAQCVSPEWWRGGCPPWPVLHCNDLSQSPVFFAPSNPTTRFERRPAPSVRRTGAPGQTRHSTQAGLLARRFSSALPRSDARRHVCEPHLGPLRHFRADRSFSAGPVSSVPVHFGRSHQKLRSPGTSPSPSIVSISSWFAHWRQIAAALLGRPGLETKSASRMRRGDQPLVLHRLSAMHATVKTSRSPRRPRRTSRSSRTPSREGLRLQGGRLPGRDPAMQFALVLNADPDDSSVDFDRRAADFPDFSDHRSDPATSVTLVTDSRRPRMRSVSQHTASCHCNLTSRALEHRGLSALALTASGSSRNRPPPRHSAPREAPLRTFDSRPQSSRTPVTRGPSFRSDRLGVQRAIPGYTVSGCSLAGVQPP